MSLVLVFRVSEGLEGDVIGLDLGQCVLDSNTGNILNEALLGV